ncbi:MAG: fumarate hydratase C-terminal domain-containing protein [Desulfofustis sp.]|nr:fumarate hydratase C-terminal domain-containing protein [Desulfofustis sp.]
MPDGVDFNGRFIYYVGPVDPLGDEVVGPAGPTLRQQEILAAKS